MKSKNILDHYNDLTDPREDNKRHLLIDIIAIVICASICSAENREDECRKRKDNSDCIR